MWVERLGNGAVHFREIDGFAVLNFVMFVALLMVVSSGATWLRRINGGSGRGLKIICGSFQNRSASPRQFSSVFVLWSLEKLVPNSTTNDASLELVSQINPTVCFVLVYDLLSWLLSSSVIQELLTLKIKVDDISSKTKTARS
jgi:hypothetical protein